MTTRSRKPSEFDGGRDNAPDPDPSQNFPKFGVLKHNTYKMQVLTPAPVAAQLSRATLYRYFTEDGAA